MSEAVCPTCGKATGEQSHLCSPGAAVGKLYICDHCGRAARDPRHVCFPKLAKMKYSCARCGRVAVWDDMLCAPQPIEGPAPVEPKPANGKEKERK